MVQGYNRQTQKLIPRAIPNVKIKNEKNIGLK